MCPVSLIRDVFRAAGLFTCVAQVLEAENQGREASGIETARQSWGELKLKHVRAGGASSAG